MTFSQVFEERGREKGIKEGIEKGRGEGIKEGRGEGAIEILLESGFTDGEIITKLVNRERGIL